MFGAKSPSSLSICLDRLVILKNQSNLTKAGNKLHNFDISIVFVPMGTEWQPIKELLCVYNEISYCVNIYYYWTGLLEQFTSGILQNDPNFLEKHQISQQEGF